MIHKLLLMAVVVFVITGCVSIPVGEKDSEWFVEDMEKQPITKTLANAKFHVTFDKDTKKLDIYLEGTYVVKHPVIFYKRRESYSHRELAVGFFPGYPRKSWEHGDYAVGYECLTVAILNMVFLLPTLVPLFMEPFADWEFPDDNSYFTTRAKFALFGYMKDGSGKHINTKEERSYYYTKVREPIVGAQVNWQLPVTGASLTATTDNAGKAVIPINMWTIIADKEKVLRISTSGKDKYGCDVIASIEVPTEEKRKKLKTKEQLEKEEQETLEAKLRELDGF